jgi:hypothetical protein
MFRELISIFILVRGLHGRDGVIMKLKFDDKSSTYVNF